MKISSTSLPMYKSYVCPLGKYNVFFVVQNIHHPGLKSSRYLTSSNILKSNFNRHIYFQIPVFQIINNAVSAICSSLLEQYIQVTHSHSYSTHHIFLVKFPNLFISKLSYQLFVFPKFSSIQSSSNISTKSL